MTEEEKKILYVPELNPERHYDTDGAFENYIPDIISTPDTKRKDKKNNKPAQIYEALEILEDTFNVVVPDDVKFIGGSIIQQIKKRLDIISPDKKRHYSEEKEKEFYKPTEIKTISTTLTDEKSDRIISLFPTPLNINLNLETPKSIVQIIQSDYEADQLNLDDYYSTKLQLILQNYIQNMLAIMAESGIPDIDNLTMKFDGEAVTIPSGKGLEHCRDFIVRSQVAREQKTRLFKKTHKTDNTVAHLRAWQAAEKQRERYYQEEYGDSGTYVESHSNELLRSQRNQYNERYKDAAYSMYKYLDSSAQLVGDTLGMIVKEAQAKAHLLNNNVNIFATSETQSPFIDNSSSSSSVTDDKNGSTDEATEADLSLLPGDKEDENHSHGQAPNGKYYSNNDWDYLSNNGLKDEQIKAILDLDPKYNKTESTDNNNNNSNNNNDSDNNNDNNNNSNGDNNIYNKLIDKAKDKATEYIKNKATDLIKNKATDLIKNITTK